MRCAAGSPRECLAARCSSHAVCVICWRVCAQQQPQQLVGGLDHGFLVNGRQKKRIAKKSYFQTLFVKWFPSFQKL